MIKNKNKLILLLILILSSVLPLYSKAKTSEKTDVSVEQQMAGKYSKSTVKDEETVVISVINFGRSNPFKPFNSVSIVEGYTDISLSDIPSPPSFDSAVTDEQLTMLMNSKVNGILYDSENDSSAIINVEGVDYLVHKGDSINGLEVKSIFQDKVILKYGLNNYSVRVGENVEQGGVNHNPVVRAKNGFGTINYFVPEEDSKIILKLN